MRGVEVLPERACWDQDGSYEAALIRIIRARKRGTGCRLSPAMVAALSFSEGDGEYYQALLDSQVSA